MRKIFMTSPVSYAVRYDINPWMTGNLDSVDSTKAAQQWSDLRNSLVAAGLDVIVLPKGPENCPDAVFTANAGLVYKNKFIPSMFRFQERSYEEEFFYEWFKHHGYDVSVPSVDSLRQIPSFEGAGDALFDRERRNLWYGIGFRSSFSFKRCLDEQFDSTDVIVRPVQLCDPRFYHLDTCFCPTDLGHLLWYPGAFEEYSRHVIETWYPLKLINVSEDDACRFACNAISIGRNLFMPKISSRLRIELEESGYNVFEHDMSEFIKGGGACKCLVLDAIE